MFKQKKFLSIIALILGVLMICAAFTGCKLRDNDDGTPESGDETPNDPDSDKYKPLTPTGDDDSKPYVPPIGAVPMDTFRINCGGARLIDPFGNEWETDEMYDPDYYGLVDGIPISYPTGGKNTQIPDLYKSIVFANPLEYRFDNIIPGTYRVKLYTAETHFEQNGRTFSVFINDVLYENNICPLDIGGGEKFVAYEPEYVVEIGNEPLIITLRASIDQSLLAGIEITPASAEELTPELTLDIDPTNTLRINCGSTDYTDSSGMLWEADRVYIKGGWGFSSDGT
ncbi:MAG: malectin, partial [Oscillospiraceae bacterium]|nr:malectin [Oscillospiraceae bacterium]